MTKLADIRFRSGTASVWTSANPVLSKGEPGYESDTGQFKIGDGTTAWASLGYAALGLAAGDTRYILATLRGAVNGVASLDASGKIPSGQLPSLRIGKATTVSSQAAMLALAADDDMQLALRSDNAGTSNPTVYALNGGQDPSTLANWQPFPVGASLTGAEMQTNKDVANGYAGLDGSGKLKIAEFPTIDGGTP